MIWSWFYSWELLNCCFVHSIWCELLHGCLDQMLLISLPRSVSFVASISSVTLLISLFLNTACRSMISIARGWLEKNTWWIFSQSTVPGKGTALIPIVMILDLRCNQLGVWSPTWMATVMIETIRCLARRRRCNDELESEAFRCRWWAGWSSYFGRTRGELDLGEEGFWEEEE